MSKIVNRRTFFRFGAGALGTLVASQSLAQACGVDTGGQPLGPFFPRPGTPIDPIHEDPDTSTPIYLANDNDLTFVRGRLGTALGQWVEVKGQVTDGDCKPVVGATIIIWQASASGRYNHKGDAANEDFEHPVTGDIVQRTHDKNFQYWGQATTNAQGEYVFKTIVPGFYPADLSTAWYRPPHIHFLISATGFPQLVTQMYFRGKDIANNDFIQDLNGKDLILQSEELTPLQRESLVVDFKTKSLLDKTLEGTFNIQIKK
ncbi:MAG: hypothetical protein KDD33_03445 [Bdellovibrionales bacterium]|nr:hypothetical protein [Bdellovibrionales bacterium]